MATKVLEFKISFGIEKNLPTNTIKSMISSLISSNKDLGRVVDFSLKPVTYTDPVINFLLTKTSYKFYKIELILLCKKDAFIDGTKTTPAEYEKKLNEILPLVSDKKGELLGIHTFSLTCTKL